MLHVYNFSLWESGDFEAILCYIVSSRTSWSSEKTLSQNKKRKEDK